MAMSATLDHRCSCGPERRVAHQSSRCDQRRHPSRPHSARGGWRGATGRVQGYGLRPQREVVLGGTVRLYRQKMLYEQIAWHTYGVVDVDNEIRTEPVMPLSDAEIRKAIIAISKEYPRFQGSGISADVDKGGVRVRGLFHDASDVLFLKRQLAEIEGVVRIEIIATFNA